MAEQANSTSTSTTANSNSSNTTSSSGSIFTRRPSFFGGKNKASRTASAAATAAAASSSTTNLNNPRASPHPPYTNHHHHYHHSRTSTPPQAILPPSSNTSSSTPPPHPTATSASQYEFPPKVQHQQQQTSPPRRKHSARHSISSSVADIGTTLRRSRSASLRTNNSSGSGTPSSSHKRTPSATLALSFSPEKNVVSSSSNNNNNNNPSSSATAASTSSSSSSRPNLSIATFSRKQKSSDNVRTDAASKQVYEKSPLSAVDNPKTPFGMNSNLAVSYNGSIPGAAPISLPLPNGSNPHVIFQHVHELASKRISTLDYLRKAHEGRIYWFNTLLFAKQDLTRLPSFTPRNLARRATNYLLLGFSLPTILDLNASSPTDYLKALNALLLEFEQYQSMHPSDGSTPSSLSRGRIPQMFKRNNLMGGKSRRSSSAANDFPLLTPQNSLTEPLSAIEPTADDMLLPNESYTYLQTPSIPFDPDFFSTFATLCDVLIDCYTKILSLLNTPEAIVHAGGGVPSLVGDLFNKADTRVRKIILGGMVKEFEEQCRAGVRGEVGGVGKVVLGGLM